MRCDQGKSESLDGLVKVNARYTLNEAAYGHCDNCFKVFYATTPCIAA